LRAERGVWRNAAHSRLRERDGTISGVSGETDDDPGGEPRDSRAFFYPDDDQPARAGGLLGGIAQMAGAALIVALIVALIIGGAVALRWVFPG
jgi:hypothetical protein